MLMNNNESTTTKKKTHLWKIFLYATIGFFSLDVVIGIIWVLFGFSFGETWLPLSLGKIASISSILGLFSLLTMNNVLRFEGGKVAKVIAIIAIVINLVWSIAWLLIVCDCFDGLKADCDYSGIFHHDACTEPYDNAIKTSWRTVGDGVVLSVFFTTLASYLSIKNRSKIIMAIRVGALVSGGILAFYLIKCISTGDYSMDSITGKMLAIMSIVYVFCIVLTPILIRAQKKKKGQNEMVNKGDDENSEVKLREKIEKEVRAQIEAENKAKNN